VDLAIFDLDNTLLQGDSDYEWGQFLVNEGKVDGAEYARKNQQFYDQYKAGSLDIYEFLSFSLQPLAQHDVETLYRWRAQFIEERIQPIILPAARELLRQHRERGDYLLIITATNRFVTEPIANELGVDDLLATDPELIDGRYTGQVAGVPCFQEGKVKRLQAWLEQHGHDLGHTSFYSDSHNDLPLLQRVAAPVAVDPDSILDDYARQKGWPVMTLRDPAGRPTPLGG